MQFYPNNWGKCEISSISFSYLSVLQKNIWIKALPLQVGSLSLQPLDTKSAANYSDEKEN